MKANIENQTTVKIGDQNLTETDTFIYLGIALDRETKS